MGSNMADSNVLLGDSEEELLLNRHRKERKQLQSKIVALKKSSSKGDKKSKRTLNEESARLEIELEAKHSKELLDFKTLNGVTEDTQALNIGSKPNQVVNGNEIQQITPRISKAQKRRDKKTVKSKERDLEITAQEVENVHGIRNVETQKIKQLLKMRNLMIKEIPSDGNCLYCAIDFQWQLLYGELIGLDMLRSRTSNYLRANSSDFLPFITHPETNDMLTEDQYKEYCDHVESTSAWGGEVELRALSQALKCSIEIIQATGPSINIGDEFKDNKHVTLTYHRHMYGLGEHYNSVQPYVESPEDENTRETMSI